MNSAPPREVGVIHETDLGTIGAVETDILEAGFARVQTDAGIQLLNCVLRDIECICIDSCTV